MAIQSRRSLENVSSQRLIRHAALPALIEPAEPAPTQKNESLPTMSGMTPQQLIDATLGRWQLTPCGDERLRPVAGQFTIDSRDVQPGDVFWALAGRHCHGSQFIPDAIARGAAGVVTDVPCTDAAAAWQLVVGDSQTALVAAAAEQRAQFTGSVIGVTGSVGKTTTRQLIDHVLSAQFWGSASPRNFNNELGVPLSMLAWDADQDYGVLELGARHEGDIARLAELAQPQIAVITRIAEAHLGSFGSRGAIARAKAELLDALPDDGWAVLNGDDSQLRKLAAGRPQRITWVGRGVDNDVSATRVRSSGGWIEFHVDGQEYRVPLWGRHHLVSALLAVAIGRAWGIRAEDLADTLAEFRSPAMRCEVTRLGEAALINDTYNSNPTAMRAALELLRDFDNTGRRIVVCGDMRELGEESAQLHRELGSDVVHVCGADMLVACGDFAADVVAGAQAAGMTPRRTIACRAPEEAAAHVSQVLDAGDVVLVKGSRAMALERCVQALEQIAGGATYRRAA